MAFSLRDLSILPMGEKSLPMPLQHRPASFQAALGVWASLARLPKVTEGSCLQRRGLGSPWYLQGLLRGRWCDRLMWTPSLCFFPPWPAYICERNILYHMVFKVLGISEPFENPKAVNLSPWNCASVQHAGPGPRFTALALARSRARKDGGQCLLWAGQWFSLVLYSVEYDFTV